MRSLTDALTELNAKVERDCWRRVGDGSFGPPFGTIRVCRHCGALVAGGPTACVDCAAAGREAVIREHEAGYREAPLDLATLRVPCTEDPADVAYIEADGRTWLTIEYGPGCAGGHRRIALTPDGARLLARALTQWADAQAQVDAAAKEPAG